MTGHIKDVELNVLSAARRISQIQIASTVKQSLTSIDAYIQYCIYRQRGLQHCLSSGKWQCESLTRGISDELVTRAFCLWKKILTKIADIRKQKFLIQITLMVMTIPQDMKAYDFSTITLSF